MNYRYGYEAPWARAKRALLAAIDQAADGEGRVDVGRVESCGRGLSRDGFTAEVDFHPDPRGLSGIYVTLLAGRDADAEYPARVRREARVLAWLEPRIRGIRVPRALHLIDDGRAPILVVSFVPGLAIDLRLGRMPIEPWQVVAEVAAAVHGVEPPPADVLPARDRSQHRAALVRELFGGREPRSGALADAYAWMREHGERAGAGALLHGDLMGHNLRWFPGEQLGAIDWEHAEIGDAAHDLAIVARGVRRPFQCPDGRKRLLAAYEARGGVEVTSEDLRFFELALHVRWAREAPDRRAESEATVARLLRGI